MSTLARIGISIFKVLDSVSEAAEVVDALYEALPEDVKKRWGRDRRPGDSFGQYGLEGADWKLEALYYNWSKVDSEQAVKNLVKNRSEEHTSELQSLMRISYAVFCLKKKKKKERTK